MGALLKPFRNILSPRGRIVPTGNLAIDWSHPLAQGLICCVVPGVSNADITGICGAFTPQTANQLVTGIDGPGISGTAVNAGLRSNSISANIASQRRFTFYYRGYVLGNSNKNGDFIGLAYNSAGTAPWVIGGFAPDSSSGSYTGMQAYWNDGSTFRAKTALPALSGGTVCSLGFTLDTVGNSGAWYISGASNTTFSTTSNAPAYTSTSLVVVNNGTSTYTNTTTFVACIWARILSDSEMAWLDAEPYCFLIPAEAEMPVLYILPPSLTNLQPDRITYGNLASGLIDIIDTSIGTVTGGTVTPDLSKSNVKAYTNNGAHTLSAPSVLSGQATTIRMIVTNAASAGAITFAGFAASSSTSAYTTTNGASFDFIVEFDYASSGYAKIMVSARS